MRNMQIHIISSMRKISSRHLKMLSIKTFYSTIKILIDAHALIYVHPHNMGLKISDFFFLTFFSEIPASN